jgi:hypothetical protein
MIEQGAQFLVSTSPLAKRVAADHQRELARFERDSAMASTARGLSLPSSDALKASANAAELAERLSLAQQGEKFRLELLGDRAGIAIGVVARPDLQRILRMLEVEVTKAGWIANSAVPSVKAASPKSVHH